MNLSKMTIREIEKLPYEAFNDELLLSCSNDNRVAIKKIISKIEKEKKERLRVFSLYKHEEEAYQKGAEFVAGVDEAGRGPLAGPLVVAATILPRAFFLPKINDSKKLSEKVREELFDLIHQNAIAINIVILEEKIIDELNIYQATVKGMYDAVLGLNVNPQFVLIDAVPLKKLPMESLSLIKGDAKSASIAAASIIAKVTRDRLMREYDKKYPQYGFAKHKGYGTAEHIQAIKKYGVLQIHRKSFEPIASMI